MICCFRMLRIPNHGNSGRNHYGVLFWWSKPILLPAESCLISNSWREKYFAGPARGSAWPWKSICSALSSAKVTLGQEGHAARCRLSPTAQPLPLTVVRLTSLGTGSTAQATSPAGSGAVGGSPPHRRADQPQQLRVPGGEARLTAATWSRRLPPAAGPVSGGVTRGCHLTDSSAPWWFSHPVTRPHVTPLLVAS